ncbi:MAG: DUF5050 domain-containing protein [Lachnospiraceae bacterium]|nr:DUF5050 domain-containing protein [Lachnospiraceae bacterium]MBO5144498.1 DUF5050 domain-containing protein [Lachnospiraceae bacterium]
MKKRIITAACVLCLILVCAGITAASYISKKIPENPAGTIGNTAGNLYNGGLFCENGGLVYFANAYDGFALYSMNADGTDIKKLISADISNINADSSFLYYYQDSLGGGNEFGFVLNSSGVYRTRKEKPKSSVCLDRISAKYVLLADNDIYYAGAGSELSVRRVSTDGDNKETLLDFDIIPAGVQDGALYYTKNSNDWHLMAMDLKTNTSRQVLAEEVYMPVIEGNMIYCIDIHDNYSLVSINISDGTKTILDSDRTDLINAADNYIYYQTSGDTPQLKRIRRDGTDMEVVAEGAFNKINATSQYIYFTRFGTDTPVYMTPAFGAVNVTTFDAASQAAIEESQKK